jgi:hypothetical protein
VWDNSERMEHLITATMVNPYTFAQFLLTEEPIEDSAPNVASVVAGTELVSPFGQ